MNQESLFGRLLKNSLFLAGSRMVDIVAVIVTTPIIARYLGLESFGNYALVTAISIFVKPLADFGFERIICRDIAKDIGASNRLISTAIVARLLLSACIIVILHLLIANIGFYRDIHKAIYISVASEFVISYCTIFLAAIRAHERMEYELFCSFAHKLTFVAGIALVVILDLGFLTIFYARLFSSLVFLGLAILIVYDRLFAFVWNFSKKTAVLILRDAYPLAIYSLLLTLSFKLDVFFLQYLKGAQEIAVFEAAHRLIMQFQFLPMSVAFAVFPFLSKLSQANAQSMRIYYERTIKLFYIFTIFPVILTLIGAEQIIRLLFGVDFLASTVVLRIIALAFMFLALVSLQHNVLIILKKQRLSLLSVAACLASKTLLDRFLIPHYGAVGAGIATLLSYFVLFACSGYFVSRHLRHMRLAGIILKPSIGALLAGIVCYLILAFSRTTGAFVIGAVSGCIVYIVCLLRFHTFSEDELAAVTRLIPGRRHPPGDENI